MTHKQIRSARLQVAPRMVQCQAITDLLMLFDIALRKSMREMQCRLSEILHKRHFNRPKGVDMIVNRHRSVNSGNTLRGA